MFSMDSVRVELNCRTPGWKRKTPLSPNTHVGIGFLNSFSWNWEWYLLGHPQLSETCFEKKGWDKGEWKTFGSWPHGHLWHGAAAVLLSVTEGKISQWNSEVDSDPGAWNHWMYREMQNDKHAKDTVIWLLLSVIAKIKVEESVGLGLDGKPSWVLATSFCAA